MKPSFVVCALLFPCCVVGQQKTHNPDQATAQAPHEPDPVAFEGVQSSLNSGRPDEALEKAKAIVQLYPDSVQANVTTGAILLQVSRPEEAANYFRKVVLARPDDPHLHSLLLEAYAESGDKQRRDAELATLRRLHTDGRHSDFAEVHGVLVERIHVGNLSIAAVAYFSPEGPHHFYYRFDEYDTSDKLIEFIALAAEDRDQPSTLSSAGKPAGRRFALTRYSQDEQALLGWIDGTPSYDDVRARVVKAVTAETDVSLPTTQ
jgi:tetratricopeptide (TPR) repeat protein